MSVFDMAQGGCERPRSASAHDASPQIGGRSSDGACKSENSQCTSSGVSCDGFGRDEFGAGACTLLDLQGCKVGHTMRATTYGGRSMTPDASPGGGREESCRRQTRLRTRLPQACRTVGLPDTCLGRARFMPPLDLGTNSLPDADCPTEGQPVSGRGQLFKDCPTGRRGLKPRGGCRVRRWGGRLQALADLPEEDRKAQRVRRMRLVATEACRRARNGQAISSGRVRRETGLQA